MTPAANPNMTLITDSLISRKKNTTDAPIAVIPQLIKPPISA